MVNSSIILNFFAIDPVPQKRSEEKSFPFPFLKKILSLDYCSLETDSCFQCTSTFLSSLDEFIHPVSSVLVHFRPHQMNSYCTTHPFPFSQKEFLLLEYCSLETDSCFQCTSTFPSSLDEFIHPVSGVLVHFRPHQMNSYCTTRTLPVNARISMRRTNGRQRLNSQYAYRAHTSMWAYRYAGCIW